jgi:UDP-N-acetylglucosamine--N-acetylmuramyl-(pentapeptide) pyrophosphoryl-undecaprenol N-acetylglucosamine transferase
MASLLGKPLVIHEQNAVAGLTNRMLACLADRVLLGLPAAFQNSNDKPLPLRQGRQRMGRQPGAPGNRRPARARRTLRRPRGRAALAGGRRQPRRAGLERTDSASTGEAGCRTTAAGASPVRRQASGCLQTTTPTAGVEAECLAFITDMAAAYAWADVVICRAGALDRGGNRRRRRAALFVPFPFAVDDHQTANARAFWPMPAPPG